MGGIESRPANIAVLSSYHVPRNKNFEAVGRLLAPLNVHTVHPPTFHLLNPEDNGFVLRENDPGIPNHLLQIQELRRMRELQNEAPGDGFGYVVDEDGAVGMHTAGEMAFLALHGIPIVASKPLDHFRDVPYYAQDTLRKTVQKILPIDEISQQNITSLRASLNMQKRPVFFGDDRRILSKLVRDALLEQRFGENLYRVLITSTKEIKRKPYQDVLRQKYPGRYVVVDGMQTNVEGVPNQPFQEQGIMGAEGRIMDALVKTAGFSYDAVGSYENFMVALDPDKFQPDKWVTPEMWAQPGQIKSAPEDLVYADVVCFIHMDLTNNVKTIAYSRPVAIPTGVALEAVKRGLDTSFAQVLHEKDPTVKLDDPHASLGNYSRFQQIYDVTQAAIGTRIFS